MGDTSFALTLEMLKTHSLLKKLHNFGLSCRFTFSHFAQHDL